MSSEINVRSDGYWIASTIGTCWYCGTASRLLALALPPGHETLAMGVDIDGEEMGRQAWDASPCNAFLFYIAFLPGAVRRRLQELSPLYRFARSTATLGAYWANHCERCGSLLDDHNLFCEPEGAFLPTSHTLAAAIRLVRIDARLEAGAAGYACDPLFFESMCGT